MATPRGAEHRDLEQRLRNIERQLQVLTGAALRRKQLSVNQGDFVVSGGGSVVVEEPGDLRIVDDQQNVVWSAAGSPTVVRTFFGQTLDASIPTSWEERGAQMAELNLAVPNGFNSARFLMFVSAGMTVPAGSDGNVSVQPMVQGAGYPASGGPAINSGTAVGGGAAVATSFWAQAFHGNIGAGTSATDLQFFLQVVRAGPIEAGSGNWHVAGQVTFYRA